jgi:hypothetical protein
MNQIPAKTRIQALRGTKLASSGYKYCCRVLFEPLLINPGGIKKWQLSKLESLT